MLLHKIQSIGNIKKRSLFLIGTYYRSPKTEIVHHSKKMFFPLPSLTSSILESFSGQDAYPSFRYAVSINVVKQVTADMVSATGSAANTPGSPSPILGKSKISGINRINLRKTAKNVALPASPIATKVF